MRDEKKKGIGKKGEVRWKRGKRKEAKVMEVGLTGSRVKRGKVEIREAGEMRHWEKE